MDSLEAAEVPKVILVQGTLWLCLRPMCVTTEQTAVALRSRYVDRLEGANSVQTVCGSCMHHREGNVDISNTCTAGAIHTDPNKQM